MNKTIILKNYLLLSKEENIELLKVRNSKSIREASLDTKEIVLSKHLLWLESLKKSEDAKYYVVIFKDEIIGAVNIFDIKEKMKWGVFFKEDANILIKSFLAIYFLDFLFKKYNKDTLEAQVKVENINALNYNKNLGFEEYSKNEEFISLSLKNESFIKRKDAKILKSIIKRMNTYEFVIKEDNEK